MSLSDDVETIQQTAGSGQLEEQIRRHKETIEELKKQGMKAPEPEGYRIPLDQRFSLACDMS